MHNAFSGGQMLVIRNARLVITQRKSRVQSAMRRWPNFERTTILGTVIQQPHYPKLERVTVGMTGVWLSRFITIWQGVVNAASSSGADGWVCRASGPGWAAIAHRFAITDDLTQLATQQLLG